jgi:hypothetical protein
MSRLRRTGTFHVEPGGHEDYSDVLQLRPLVAFRRELPTVCAAVAASGHKSHVPSVQPCSGTRIHGSSVSCETGGPRAPTSCRERTDSATVA